MPSNRNSRLVQYRRQRRKFACKVYGLAAVFLFLTFLQWIVLNKILDMDTVFVKNYYIALVSVFAGLLLVTLFVFLENIRFIVPINWVLSLLIVECVTIGLARLVAESTATLTLFSFLFTSLLVLFLIVLGIFCPRDLTLDVVILFVGAIIFFIGGVIFVMLHIMTETPHTMYFYAFFVGITVVMFTMYHAQTINGSRYAEMRLKDYLLASLIIYHDFIILFMLMFCLLPALKGVLPNGAPLFKAIGVRDAYVTSTAAPATTAAAAAPAE